MKDKRQYKRYKCKISVRFSHYQGNPEDIDKENTVPIKGKGWIMDWSRGGVFIVTKSRINMNMPINLRFKLSRKKININGTIVRTGMIENNPSESAQRLQGIKVKGDAYVAVKFDNLIDDAEKLSK